MSHNDDDSILSPNVRTDRADAAHKLQIVGRMVKDCELLTRRTTLLDPDAREILILRRVLGDLIEKNHTPGYKAAKALLLRLESAPARAVTSPSAPRMGRRSRKPRMGRVPTPPPSAAKIRKH